MALVWFACWMHYADHTVPALSLINVSRNSIRILHKLRGIDLNRINVTLLVSFLRCCVIYSLMNAYVVVKCEEFVQV